MNDAAAAVIETAGQPSHRWIDPFYLSDDEHTPSPVWADALALRDVLALVKNKQSPNSAQRMILLRALMKQIPVLLLYRHVLAQRDEIVAQTNKALNATLYVIVFPGEGKDNTGIKQLNDKVLGYYWNSQFILRRQREIETLFPVPWDGTAPGFGTVGQDYKTASIVAVGKSRKEFDAELVKLDDELRKALIDILDLAAKDKRTPNSRKPAIKELRDKLTKKGKTPYRFDYLVGSAVRTVKPDSPSEIAVLGRKHTPIDIVYLLLTEALKGAGIARFGVKMRDVAAMKSGKKGLPRPSAARKLAKSYFLTAQPKGLDPRARDYDWTLFMRVSTAAQAVRKVLSTPYSADDPFDRVWIYVNGVWTVCFIEFDEEEHRLIAHPDVVRDARKRAIGPPPTKDGFKAEAVIRDQSTLLEMWMASLNLLDLIKDFLFGEFRGLLVRYLDRASASWTQVRDIWGDIDATQLECVLTRDLRQRADPYPVQGCASEFLFYAPTADQMDRLFFVMDVRDLGVDLLTLYELTNDEIQMRKISDVKLLERTILASDIINIRKRAIVDAVIDAFRKQHSGGGADWKRAQHDAFGSALNKLEEMPDFERSMIVLLGGDEVFVSAHPAYAGREAAIVKDLDARTVQGLPLNMRAAVVYSSARGAPAGASPRQQELNILAHDQALMLASEASEPLKKLERTHRRIERLIEKLELSPKQAKQAKAPDHYKSLEALGLMKVFARAKRYRAAPLSPVRFKSMLSALRQGDTAKASKAGNFELVDFAGKEVNEDTLTKAATKLEEQVWRDVYPDNLYVQPPSVTKEPKVPKWLKKIIDWFKWIGGADADLDEKRMPKADEDGFEECGKVHIA